MPVSPTGELIDEKGNPIGGRIDVKTGQFTEQPPSAITSASLTPVTPLSLPQIRQEPDYLSSLNSIITQYQQPPPQEGTQDEISKMLLDVTKSLGGQQAVQFKAEETAGLPGFQKQLGDVMGQIQTLQKEAAAIPLQIQEEFAGRAGVGQQRLMTESDLRKNTIKALGLSAIAQTLQGQASFAQQQANRVVELEFAPKVAQLEFLKAAYSINRDALERYDKKRADALGILLGERNRILNEQKENANKVMDIRMQFALNGGDVETQQLLEREKDPNRALTLASRTLGEEFRQKQEEKQFQRDLQTATYNLSVEKFREDARQFNLGHALDQQKLDYDKFKDSQKLNPVATAEATSEILQDKISLIDSLLSGAGLKGSVGVYPIGRFTPFAIDKAARAEFAAGVTQLVNKETIDTLVNLKARGGTLGALSDQERILLQSAATKIGTWEIKKDGIGTGRYRVSEEDFKAELNRIKDLAIKAKARALGGGPTQTNTEADQLRAAGYSEEQIKLLMELE